MKTAIAVIGANFGDEGKGKTVDFLADTSTLVVRYNGGAQAGHTVQVGGLRHIFSHWGSGTFKTAPTYFSRFTIVNPEVWVQEREELRKLLFGALPDFFLSTQALLTTPYDMWINQRIEKARGGARHGSCGLGINETVVRNQHPEFSTIAWDMRTPGWLRGKLQRIREEWVPRRLGELGLHGLDAGSWFVPSLEEEFFQAVGQMGYAVQWESEAILGDFEKVIFEGAQGLLLDEHHRFFPHVTRSRPGMHNVMKIVDQVGIDTVDVRYVTRTYLTRHGEGPFPTADFPAQFDKTNHSNPWQGSMRFGELNIPLLKESITEDRKAEGRALKQPSLVINHFDQHHGPWALTDEIERGTELRALLCSDGPDRSKFFTRV